jgi:hypothetical protein
VLLHVAALSFPLGNSDRIVDRTFHDQAEAILDGELPYSDRHYEYPPLSLPVVLAPALISDSEPSYRAAFGWEMLAFDLAIVLLLAFGLRGDRRLVWGALAVWSVGMIGLSNLGPLPDSDIDGQPLGLARFDLVPAALILAAALARERLRSALWSFLLTTAVAVKFFPIFLYPNWLRDEAQLRRAAAAAIPPLVLSAALVLLTGDDFGSAISYHTGRDLQIETLGATPFLIAHLFGGEASTVVGAGGWNLDAGGAEAARAISIGLFLGGWAILAIEGWRRRVPPLEIATAILAVMILFAPVLSPQFLFWVLPVSAAAYGLRLPNLLLLLSVGLTQLVLSLYGGVTRLSDSFVLAVSLRNLVLIAFTAAAITSAFGRTEADLRAEPRPASA